MSSSMILNAIITIVFGLLMIVTIMLAKVIKLKTAMELFSTDLITVVVSFMIVYFSMFFALYMIFIQVMIASSPAGFDPGMFGTDLSGFDTYGGYGGLEDYMQ